MNNSLVPGQQSPVFRRVQIITTNEDASEVLVRDGNGWSTRLDGRIRQKGTGLPEINEVWLIERVGPRWLLKAQEKAAEIDLGADVNAIIAQELAEALEAAALEEAERRAQEAALAAGILGGDAEVLIQDEEPGSEHQNGNTLWIDTSFGRNRPMRWDPEADQWVAVIDQIAIEAALAAVAAAQAADAAQEAADTAQEAVDSLAQIVLVSAVMEYSVNTSETEPPTTGWSEVTPERPPGTFIWFRSVYTYGDESVVISNPALLTGNTGEPGQPGEDGSPGIPGEPGDDGTTYYTWIKYADTPTSGMSDDPEGKTYFGIAINQTNPTESEVYSDYTWSKIMGEDGAPGIPGEPGEDGVTTYTWIKYAYDIVGTGISDDPTDRDYIGLAYNKLTEIESDDPEDYVWSLYKGADGSDGLPGPPGEDGQTFYTWLKYADDADGNGMADLPEGKKYMGLALNRPTPTESTNPEDYQWSLIRGEDAQQIILTATTQVLTVLPGEASTTPVIATITGTAIHSEITDWSYSQDSGAWTTAAPPGVLRVGNEVAIEGEHMAARTIAVKAANSDGSVSDTMTVAKMVDGADGEDAYTVLLTNESHTFPGSTSAALEGSTTVGVIAFRGTVQVGATIGTVTGHAPGLTTTIQDNGTPDAQVTVTVTTSLTQSGELTIPVTVEGHDFTKVFSWSVTFRGNQGVPGTPGDDGQPTYVWVKYADDDQGTGMSDDPAGKTYIGLAYNRPTEIESDDPEDYVWSLIQGAPGEDGVGIVSVTPFFRLLPSSDPVPSAPTTNPPSGDWTETEPGFRPYHSLYRTDRIVYTDDSFAYTTVTKVAAYEGIETIRNLINNPSKSGNHDRWSTKEPATISIEYDTFGPEALPVLKFTSSTGEALETDPFPVDPTRAYEVRWWLRTESTGDSSTLRYGMKVFLEDGTATYARLMAYDDGTPGSDTQDPLFQLLGDGASPEDYTEYVGYLLPYETPGEDAVQIGKGVRDNIRMEDPRTASAQFVISAPDGTVSRDIFVAHAMVTETSMEAIRLAGRSQRAADAAMVSANGKNLTTYTDIGVLDPRPGPAPEPDPERTVGDTHRNRLENFFDPGEHGIILAEWRWSGVAWEDVWYGDEMLSSLDVGKLVAGTADIDTAVINKFWADEGFINHARTSVLTVASITPEMLTTMDELSVNPTWSREELRDVAPYDLPGLTMNFTTFGSYQYRGGTHVLMLSISATLTNELRITDDVPVTPGELIHARAVLRKVNSTTPGSGSSARLVAHWFNSIGTEIGTSAYEITHTEGVTWRTYETLFDVPDGATNLYVTVSGGSVFSQAYLIGATSVRRTMASIDQDGIQTVISPSGVEVSILIATDAGYDRVVLTSMGRIYSAYDPETDQSSTMTGNEVATGVLAARDDVTINGESVRDAIAASGGRVVMFDRAADAGALSLDRIGYREFGFEAEGGQAYLLIVKVDILISAAGQSFLYLHKTEAAPGSSPTPPTISTPEFARHAFYATGGGEQVYLIAAFVPNTSESTRWLIAGRSGGSRTLQFRDMWAYAIRLGNFTELPSSGRYTYGGATPTEPSPPTPPVDPNPPPQTYVHTSVFGWSRTYNNFGSNPSAWVDPGLMRQGAAGSSRYMALVGMSAAARSAAMAGQISKMEMYVYHDGPTPSGTLKISTHQQASMPAFSSGPSVTLFDSYKDKYLARSSGSWITLPSAWYPDFQSGLRRGFAFGSTTGNWGLMDLAAHDYTHSNPTTQAERRPKIRITYVS